MITDAHRLPGEGVDHLGCRQSIRVHSSESSRMDLLRVEVLRPVGVLLELLAAAVSEKLVVGDLDLEGTRVPCVVQVGIIGMDEGQLLVWRSNQYALADSSQFTH